MDIPVIHEDTSLLVLDKPVGISVTREGLESDPTVQDWVSKRFNSVGAGDGEDNEFEQRNGIVHRLDKDTSGVLLVAKDVQVYLFLKGLFKYRRIQKEYQVLVYGDVQDTKFEVFAPISRRPGGGVGYSVVEGGRESLTEFEVLRRLYLKGVHLTYLVARPKTGRTHQIRVHLKALGHPVVNDKRYSRHLFLGSSSASDRMMLHAKKITFVDWEGKNRCFVSPTDLSSFLPTE